MKKEKGVTLIALVIMIIILLILASIGINSGQGVIETANFNEFTSELKILQTKVNQLNQDKKNNIGIDLTDEQKKILEKEEIADILYKNKTDEQIAEIKSGFKYFSKEYIKEELELSSVKRDFLINVDKRLIVCCKGFEHNGKVYYMSEQMAGGLYNVEYNDKNNNDGNFEVISTLEDNKWKISVVNIEYSGYINNWQVKYQLNGEDYWNTSNELYFYVKDEGTYNIKVVHGDEVNLGTQTIQISKDYVLKYNSNSDSEDVENLPTNVLREENKESIKISEEEPIRDGYEFLGWGTSAEDTEAKYQSGDVLQITEEDTIELYAIWIKKE